MPAVSGTTACRDWSLNEIKARLRVAPAAAHGGDRMDALVVAPMHARDHVDAVRAA